MLSLSELAKLLEQPGKPFADWQPQHCGELPIHIDEHGEWFYSGSKINRPAMVKLFASVLCKEAGQFYLKTPIEKIAVTVADAPFIITTWQWQQTTQGQVICSLDNIDRQWLVSAQHPLKLDSYQNQPIPYLQLPHGLTARVSRNVYYQWAEIAKHDQQGYFIESAGCRFYMD